MCDPQVLLMRGDRTGRNMGVWEEREKGSFYKSVKKKERRTEEVLKGKRANMQIRTKI